MLCEHTRWASCFVDMKTLSGKEGEEYLLYFLGMLLSITNLNVKCFLFKMGIIMHTMPIIVRMKDYTCKSPNSAWQAVAPKKVLITILYSAN